jgi:hypothetical protein
VLEDVNKVAVERIPDPQIRNSGDVAAVHPNAARADGPRRAEDRAHDHAHHVARRRPQGYHIFKDKIDGCVRAVFTP